MGSLIAPRFCFVWVRCLFPVSPNDGFLLRCLTPRGVGATLLGWFARARKVGAKGEILGNWVRRVFDSGGGFVKLFLFFCFKFESLFGEFFCCYMRV